MPEEIDSERNDLYLVLQFLLRRRWIIFLTWVIGSVLVTAAVWIQKRSAREQGRSWQAVVNVHPDFVGRLFFYNYTNNKSVFVNGVAEGYASFLQQLLPKPGDAPKVEVTSVTGEGTNFALIGSREQFQAVLTELKQLYETLEESLDAVMPISNGVAQRALEVLEQRAVALSGSGTRKRQVDTADLLESSWSRSTIYGVGTMLFSRFQQLELRADALNRLLYSSQGASNPQAASLQASLREFRDDLRQRQNGYLALRQFLYGTLPLIDYRDLDTFIASWNSEFEEAGDPTMSQPVELAHSRGALFTSTELVRMFVGVLVSLILGISLALSWEFFDSNRAKLRSFYTQAGGRA